MISFKIKIVINNWFYAFRNLDDKGDAAKKTVIELTPQQIRDQNVEPSLKEKEKTPSEPAR